MTLVFGGAYQGKLIWALEDLKGKPSKVFACRDNLINIDLTSDIIDGLHLYLLALIREGRDPVAEAGFLLDSLENKTMIIEDITGGIVPIEAEMRAWREAVGRVMGLLSARASRVVRVFCGIGIRLR